MQKRQLFICFFALFFAAVGDATAASRCHDAIQGKIAWNYEGATRWNSSNIDRLCGAAEDSVEPARCFERVMHGGIDWGGGTQWEWSNAVDLCEGTRDSEGTVRCFERKIEGGLGWKQAIQTCQWDTAEGSDEFVTDIAVPLESDAVAEAVADVATKGVEWTAGSGWEQVGKLSEVTHIAACTDAVFALRDDGRVYQTFSTDASGNWSVTHRFDREIQSLICNRRMIYLDGNRRLFAGTDQLGHPYAAADLAAAEPDGDYPSLYYALNDDRTLWENRGRPEDEGWRKIGRPADARRIAAARGVLFALNDDGSFHVTRKPGDSRYWHRLGMMEGAIDIAAVYEPDINGAVIFAVDENGRVFRGEVRHLLAGLTSDGGLEPKPVPRHPRLATIPAIHFDHHNSSVSDLSAPRPRNVRVDFIRYDFPMGLCLNYLLDDAENIHAFCGNSLGIGGRIAFELTLFDDDLEKVDEHEVTRFASVSLMLGNLPMNLGYFVMDRSGRVIVVENETDVVFVKKRGNRLEAVETWSLGNQIRTHLERELGSSALATFDDSSIGQVFPAYDDGYWLMSLGELDDRDVEAPAFVGFLSDGGRLRDVHVFDGEVIENGMTLDASGAYVITDHALYKLAFDGRIKIEWREGYDRHPSAEEKPGTISKWGSGSTPTLVEGDLIAFTDNARNRVNLVVRERGDGDLVCKVPLFEPGKSANENTVLSYGRSIVVQNWLGSPPFNKSMWGLEPGLTRIHVGDSDCEVVWHNDEFASTPTIRLSTETGLLYGTIQTAENDAYAMSMIDFATGEEIDRFSIGEGKKYRLSMSPAYFVPGGRLIQPVRRGIVVIENR